MKKALILFAIVVFNVCTGWLFGQETQKPYSYTFDKGVGECIFTGVSLDQVWSAAVKALMQDKFIIVSSDKNMGTMIAEQTPYAGLKKLTKTGEPEGAQILGGWDITILFEQKGYDVCITASVTAPKGVWLKVRDKKVEYKEEKKFFDKVVELLYGKVEKK
jgi:hypothetical protein